MSAESDWLRQSLLKRELAQWRKHVRGRHVCWPVPVEFAEFTVAIAADSSKWTAKVLGPKGTPFEDGHYTLTFTLHSDPRVADILSFEGAIPKSPKVLGIGHVDTVSEKLQFGEEPKVQLMYDVLATVFFNCESDFTFVRIHIGNTKDLMRQLIHDPLATCDSIALENERSAKGAKAVFFLPPLSSDSEYFERIDAIKESCHSVYDCADDVIDIILECFGSYRAYRGLRHFYTGATDFFTKDLDEKPEILDTAVLQRTLTGETITVDPCVLSTETRSQRATHRRAASG